MSEISPGKKITHVLICLLVLVFFSTFSLAEEKGGEQQEQKGTAQQEKEPSGGIASRLIEVYRFSNKLPRELIDLESSLDAISHVDELLKTLPEVEKEMEKLDWEIMMLGSNTNPSYHQLTSLDTRLEKLKTLLSLRSLSPGQRKQL